MNPWTIIGWSILAYAVYCVLRWCWDGISAYFDLMREVRRQWNIEPAPNQRWKVAGEDIEIVKVDDAGIHWKDRYRLGPGGVMSRETWRAAIMGGMRFVR